MHNVEKWPDMHEKVTCCSVMICRKYWRKWHCNASIANKCDIAIVAVKVNPLTASDVIFGGDFTFCPWLNLMQMYIAYF